MTKPKNTPTPVFPAQPVFPTAPTSPTPEAPGPEQPVGECQKCHIKLYRVMLYSCPRQDCPCFLRVSY